MFKNIAIAAALAAGAFSAQAGTITLTQGDVNALATTEISNAYTFAGFDTMGGTRTLTGVSIELDGRAVSSVSFTNSAAQDQRFQFASSLNLFLDGAGLSETLELSLFNYGPTVTPVGTTDLGQVDRSGTLTATGTSSVFLNPVTLTCESLVTNTQAGGGGNITVNQATQAACQVAITYTYDATTTSVPEPSVALMLGLGLFGLGATRRFVRKD